MEYLRRGRRRCGLVSNLAIVCCGYLCFVSLYGHFVSKYSWSSVHLDHRSSTRDSYAQLQLVVPPAAGSRRELRGGGGGPGSRPPRCAAKCGGCSPCSPVHVTVPPGAPVTSIYYPVAWRCKCGDKLFMP